MFKIRSCIARTDLKNKAFSAHSMQDQILKVRVLASLGWANIGKFLLSVGDSGETISAARHQDVSQGALGVGVPAQNVSVSRFACRPSESKKDTNFTWRGRVWLHLPFNNLALQLRRPRADNAVSDTPLRAQRFAIPPTWQRSQNPPRLQKSKKSLQESLRTSLRGS